MKQIRILNLGGGVGSAPLVGMQIDGELQYDVAIFSDTCDEPSWVYKQVQWLKQMAIQCNGAPIVEVSGGDLMAQLREGVYCKNGTRFASIPAYTLMPDGSVSMTRRQCTREYKIAPVEQYIRREILKLDKGQRIPKGTTITQIFGFSSDEAGRAARMRGHETATWRFEFPLIEFEMRKSECRKYMAKWCTEFEWMWSSCRSCPYHNDIQWRELKANSPEDFEAACVNDDALRDGNSICNRGMYLHRSCKPLREVDFTKGGQQEMFNLICDGGCLT